MMKIVKTVLLILLSVGIVAFLPFMSAAFVWLVAALGCGLVYLIENIFGLLLVFIVYKCITALIKRGKK